MSEPALDIPDYRQLAGVAVHITAESLTQGRRIARVGLHAGALLIELPRGDHQAMCPGLLQRPAQPKAKPTRLIDHVHRVACGEQPFDPRHELRRPKAPRRPQRRMIVLRHDDVGLAVDVQPELDHCGLKVSLRAGDRGCGRPFVMNRRFIHKAGELPSSPASFHAIYALQAFNQVKST